MNKDTIKELAFLFRDRGIYSKHRYEKEDCPLRYFQRKFRQDSYKTDIETFLNIQLDFYSGKGADLPWWGNRYFTNDDGIRIMILSQDSRNPDGGSVALYSPFLEEKGNNDEYRNIIDSHNNWSDFPSFEKIKGLLNQCPIDFDFIYVTDAMKIEKGWKELLEEEIQIIEPDIILCLGNIGLMYLLKRTGVIKMVDKGDTRELIHPKSLPKMACKPVLVTSVFPTDRYGNYNVDRERNVVNTLTKALMDLKKY